ncbi:MAG: hypothetical protein GVY16_01340 [Planctomycetes bacterium]|jgi:HEAT repeat protein|nr:hypothetical protein [Planctomycetota bacterium]
MLRKLGLLLLIVVGLVVGSCAPGEEGLPLTAAQKLHLQTLRRQLTAAQRQPQTREEAARLLLSEPYPQATQALLDVLTDASLPAAQIAVANAVADAGNAPTSFVAPLLDMLTGETATLRAAAARALVTYQNHGVTDRLIRIARDRNRPTDVRLAVIESLRRIIAKPSIRALIDLLGEASPEIRAAAAESLARLTNIRSYGEDRDLWEVWWARNRDTTRAEWLAELAESLSRAQMALESENRQLRERLVGVMTDLYNLSPKTRRPAMLLDMYASPVGDIRLLAGRLADKMIATSEPINPEIRQRIRSTLDDSDPRVRELAAILEASLPDETTPQLLMTRLDEEESPLVRAGILRALGQLRTTQAIPAILRKLSSRDEAEASAAAEALARIASEQPLNGELQAAVAKALTTRYDVDGAGEKLREALLRAMGAVADSSTARVLIAATTDPAGTVRLAAVTGLARLEAPEAVEAVTARVTDSDRGVRQAALAALAALGGQEALPVLLARTDASVEADATVRKQAWEEVLKLAADADADILADMLETLADRDDGGEQRIVLLQMRVDALRRAESAALPAALMRLAEALGEADRAGEAVKHATEAWQLAVAEADPEKEPSDALRSAWRLHIATRLAANNPGVVKAIATRPAKGPLASEAIDMLFGRLAALREDKNHLAVITLTDAALTGLADRLPPNRRQHLRTMLKTALAAQAERDRTAVNALLPALLAADAAARTDAENRIKTMGERAARPLVEELGKSLEADKPHPKLEKAIIELLKQVAPKLGAYDCGADVAQKRQVVRGWLKQL